MGGTDRNPQTEGVTQDQYRQFTEVLVDAVHIAEEADVPFLGAGSLAGATWGRPAAVGDIDLLISPMDAKKLLAAFEEAGYETSIRDPQWIYKASKSGVTVDLIFQMQGSLYLEEEMLEKAVVEEVHGVKMPLMPPEDYIISQALSTREDTPDYWYNALGVISKCRLDWDYLVARASRGPRRVLSLLIYAQAEDLQVPDMVVRRLFDQTFGP